MTLLPMPSPTSDQRDVALLGLDRRDARVHHPAGAAVADIARDERVTPDYLYIVLRLRWLAPCAADRPCDFDQQQVAK